MRNFDRFGRRVTSELIALQVGNLRATRALLGRTLHQELHELDHLSAAILAPDQSSIGVRKRLRRAVRPLTQVIISGYREEVQRWLYAACDLADVTVPPG